MTVSPSKTLVCLAMLSLSAGASAAPMSAVQCRQAGNSTGKEPAWYAAACGWMHEGQPRATKGRGMFLFPGDPAFHIDLRATPDNFQTFALPNANTATTLGQIAAGPSFFGLEHDNTTGILYGVDNVTRNLVTFNKATGAFTTVVTITGLPAAPASVTGLAFQSLAGPVYVSTATELYTVNTGTGAATLVGPFGTTLMIDVAINSSGQMYGHDIGTDSLYSINTATGTATLIGPTGQNANFAQSIDFDKTTGVLYGWMYLGAGANNFSQFNLATGAATILNSPTNIEAEGALTPVELQGFQLE